MWLAHETKKAAAYRTQPLASTMLGPIASLEDSTMAIAQSRTGEHMNCFICSGVANDLNLLSEAIRDWKYS